MNENIKITEKDFPDRLLRLALDVGEGMLKSGADIHRVEETIEKICKSYGAAHVEVFAITSMIVASVRLDDGEYSMQMRRIHSSANHLLKVEEYNKISRIICERRPELDEFEEMIRDVKRKMHYPRLLSILGAFLVASSFTVLFGGDLLDAAVAGIIGILIVVLESFSFENINEMIKTVIISFVCGFAASSLVRFGIGHNANEIMIGTIMLLIPGIAFGNSIKDFLEGDYIAGGCRLLQSCIGAVMIAIGYGLAIIITEAIL